MIGQLSNEANNNTKRRNNKRWLNVVNLITIKLYAITYINIDAYTIFFFIFIDQQQRTKKKHEICHTKFSFFFLRWHLNCACNAFKWVSVFLFNSFNMILWKRVNWLPKGSIICIYEVNIVSCCWILKCILLSFQSSAFSRFHYRHSTTDTQRYTFIPLTLFASTISIV